MANVSVEVRIDILTTDLAADDARGFRDDADKALRAYLDAVAARVK